MTRLFVLFVLLIPLRAKAQTPATTTTPAPRHSAIPALRHNFNPEGSHYFQITFLNQTWIRWNEHNPGTTIDQEPRDQSVDIGLRRTRIQMFGQLSDRTFLYFQFGQNNFNAQYNYGGNRKNAVFFHDAVCEQKLSRADQLKVGAGLTIANGLSRFSQPSIGTIMTLDVPVFAQATVDQTDEFSRKLSVYARGQVGRIDYRVSLSEPFPILSNGTTPPPLHEHATFTQRGHTWQYQAMAFWQFFDKEPHTTPYMTGTFLGKKKILSVGGGLIYQPRAMWRKAQGSTDTLYQDLMLWCTEAFLDIPLNTQKGTALSAYAGFFSYDFGTNYLRFNGLMNPATGTQSANTLRNVGPVWGNAYPMFGTGRSVYLQAGYLLPRSFLGEEREDRLSLFGSWHHAAYDRLQGQAVDILTGGINWLIHEHKSKISLQFENRPTFFQTDADIQAGPRRSCVVLQYQIFI